MGTLNDKAKLFRCHPRLGMFAVWMAARMPNDFNIIWGYRSPEEQAALPAGATNAKAGQSPHQYGLAVDFQIVPETADNQRKIGECVDAWNRRVGSEELTWGGTWSDPYDPRHVQLTNWRDHKEWKAAILGVALVIALAGWAVFFSKGSANA